MKNIKQPLQCSYSFLDRFFLVSAIGKGEFANILNAIDSIKRENVIVKI